MKILGVTSWFHDSSAALLVDGDIVAYAEEERFSRRKHTPAYPKEAIDWILESNGLDLDDIDEVVFYLKPSRYILTGIKALAAYFPGSLGLLGKGAATVPPLRRLWLMSRLKPILCEKHNAKGRFKVTFLEHYKTHQASTFYASGFDDAAILTMDFAVDGTTEVIAHGRGLDITDKLKHRIPNGMAVIFTAVTHVLGFKWDDEYKVMGMAAYGKPRFLDQIKQLFRFDESTGRLDLNLEYFDFQREGRSRLYTQRMTELFGAPRKSGDALTQRDYDLAASLQAATTEYGLSMAGLAKQITGSRNLCMAGGVAQNCLMNQAICAAGLFENVFIQPLSGDVGGSLGGALHQYHCAHRHPRKYVTRHLFLGPDYNPVANEAAARYGLIQRPSESWHEEVAQAIADGLIIGYVDGRMEAGPRALGGRSILADPRRPDMKETLNARVKHREHFRPFAPSVLAEHINDVFEPLPACRSLPFMITTMTVKEEWRSRVPTITHDDATSRVQAVEKEYAPNFHAIISAFYRLTGVPLIVNTSFNDNEPIVCTPDDAIRCFLRTRIDLLVLGGRLYYRVDNATTVGEEALAR